MQRAPLIVSCPFKATMAPFVMTPYCNFYPVSWDTAVVARPLPPRPRRPRLPQPRHLHLINHRCSATTQGMLAVERRTTGPSMHGPDWRSTVLQAAVLSAVVTAAAADTCPAGMYFDNGRSSCTFCYAGCYGVGGTTYGDGTCAGACVAGGRRALFVLAVLACWHCAMLFDGSCIRASTCRSPSAGRCAAYAIDGYFSRFTVA